MVFVTVLLHALGVTPRPAAAVFGSSIVRTKLPLVVISSTYSGLVFWFVPPVVHTNVLPVSSPMRTTARLPPTKGTGAVVGAGVMLCDGVALPVGEYVTDAVADAVMELDSVRVLEQVADVVAAAVGVTEGLARNDKDAVAEAVLVPTPVEDPVLDTVGVDEPVPLCDNDVEGDTVGDALASAGANATLWYSTLRDEGPRIEVHTPVCESYRTTWLLA